MPAIKLEYLCFIGKQISNLTILEIISKAGKTTTRKRRHFVCKCVCGKWVTAPINDILNGNTKSCGCLRVKVLRELKTKHGYANEDKFKEGYRSWYAMKSRCNNPKNPRYNDWGARGITVCDRWLNSFNNFIEDMGPRPSHKHSIDRVNNDGNYEPSNCRWATSSEQRMNQRK